MKKPGGKITVSLVFCLFLAACGAQNTEEMPEAPAESVEESVDVLEEPSETAFDAAVMETVIDFPFPSDVEESCKLTLACMDVEAGLYELRFYDKDGNAAQKLSCGHLKEPIRFSYDNLTPGDDYYNDLEIFPDDASDGLLFILNRTAVNAGGLFWESAVEIPVYDEVLADYCFITSKEDEIQHEEIIYRINMEETSAQPLRRLTLQKESAMLEIWDYLENQSIFSSEAVLKEDGSLANAEYYQYLLRDSRYPFYRGSDSDTDITIPVWFSYTDGEESHVTEFGEKNNFERIQEIFFGNNGHMAEYEDRKTFLSDFGFDEQEPFYCFYDQNNNLQLEFYLDEESGLGCGLIHKYHYTYQMEKEEFLYGFAFDEVSDGVWEPIDPCLLTSIDGYTGKDDVTDYEEHTDYTENGKVDCYQSLGVIDWLYPEGETPDEKDTILKINFIYRDDGSLIYREYSHHGQVFGTTYQSWNSCYDELERPVYETAYITHGNLEYYYIYDDAGGEPAYELFLDDNLGYCIPTLIRFH